MRPRCGFILVALLALICGGCTPSPAPPAAKPQAPAAASPRVSQEQAQEFARQFVEAIHQHDAAALDALFDWEAILDIGMAGIDSPAGQRQAFRKGFLSAQRSSGGMARELTRPELRSAKLLRTRVRDQRTTTLIRILADEGAMVYCEPLLTESADGRVRAVDIYLFSSGETLSATIRRGHVATAAHANRTFLERLSGVEGDYAKHAVEIQAMGRAAAAGEGQKALAIFEKLPDSLQRDKSMLLLRIRAAQSVDEKTYASAIEALRQAHPRDPAGLFHALDQHALAGEWEKTLTAVDRLDRAVGGDPYMQVMRGNCLMALGRFAEARAAAKAALAEEPDLVQATELLATIDQAEAGQTEATPGKSPEPE
jgi:tetratricopeptide (TPR) repeat protein